MSSELQDKKARIVVVDNPFNVDESEEPFGKRWGGECFTLSTEHLAALQAGKTLALDVQNEYVTFVRLEPTEGKTATIQQTIRRENDVTEPFQSVSLQLSALFRQAIHAANGDVDDIIQNRERDTNRIDHQLDHMLGFCCDPDMLVAFKRLCRYYFTIDPVATTEHINAYRDMWDKPDETVGWDGV